MAIAKDFVYMQALQPNERPPGSDRLATRTRLKGQQQGVSHAQKQRHLNPRDAHESHYLEPTGHSFKDPSVPKLNTSRYHQQQGGTGMLCGTFRSLEVPSDPLNTESVSLCRSGTLYI